MNPKESSYPAAASEQTAITELALTVFRLNGALLHWGDRLVQPLGLSSARWQMLGAIALAQTPLTAPQIGEAMGVTRQGAQKQLNLLLQQALVKMQANPAHRRSPLYALTAQGLALYRQAEALWSSQASELGKVVAATQAQVAAQTLQSLLHQLQATAPSLEVEP